MEEYHENEEKRSTGLLEQIKKLEEDLDEKMQCNEDLMQKVDGGLYVDVNLPIHFNESHRKT